MRRDQRLERHVSPEVLGDDGRLRVEIEQPAKARHHGREHGSERERHARPERVALRIRPHREPSGAARERHSAVIRALAHLLHARDRSACQKREQRGPVEGGR